MRNRGGLRPPWSVVPLRIDEGTGEGPAPMAVNDDAYVEPAAVRDAQGDAQNLDDDVHTTTPVAAALDRLPDRDELPGPGVEQHVGVA